MSTSFFTEFTVPVRSAALREATAVPTPAIVVSTFAITLPSPSEKVLRFSIRAVISADLSSTCDEIDLRSAVIASTCARVLLILVVLDSERIRFTPDTVTPRLSIVFSTFSISGAIFSARPSISPAS